MSENLFGFGSRKHHVNNDDVMTSQDVCMYYISYYSLSPWVVSINNQIQPCNTLPFGCWRCCSPSFVSRASPTLICQQKRDLPHHHILGSKIFHPNIIRFHHASHLYIGQRIQEAYLNGAVGYLYFKPPVTTTITIIMTAERKRVTVLVI